MTLAEICLLIVLWPVLSHTGATENTLVFTLKWMVLIYVMFLPIFSQLDARSRFQNYKQIKDQIHLYGFDERIFKPVLKSRCQRDAAWLSAHELGIGDTCKNYFSSKGYRWFHLFPDFVFTHPQFMLSPFFWKTTFFTPRYKSKIDYSEFRKYNLSSDLTNNIPCDAV